MSTASSPRRADPSGAWLADLRRRAGLSRAELARRVAASPAAVARVELGGARLRPERYRVWAGALDAPIDAFTRDAMAAWDPALFDLTYGPDRVFGAEPPRAR